MNGGREGREKIEGRRKGWWKRREEGEEVTQVFTQDVPNKERCLAHCNHLSKEDTCMLI